MILSHAQIPSILARLSTSFTGLASPWQKLSMSQSKQCGSGWSNLASCSSTTPASNRLISWRSQSPYFIVFWESC